jgi:predicted nucleic acid-binding protein
MTVPVFVDTNVLIYALNRGDPKKQHAAQAWRAELWKNHNGRISFQVLQEFYVNVAQKWPSACDQARAEIRDLMAWRPATVDGPILEGAWRIQDRYQLSFWDALIVGAAKSLACRYLLTEDLQADQELDGIIVINPFLRDPASLLHNNR